MPWLAAATQSTTHDTAALRKKDDSKMPWLAAATQGRQSATHDAAALR